MDKYCWTWISQIKRGDIFLYKGQVDVRVLQVEELAVGFLLTLQRITGGRVVMRYYQRETLLYVRVNASVVLR
jgi:hypothetical protein